MTDGSEKELNEPTQQLAKVNTELDRLLSGIAHDFRAPLSVISGFSYLLKRKYDGDLDDLAQEYITQIVNACGRMDSLIEDLTKLSRVSQAELHITSVNLSDIAKQVVKNISTKHSEYRAKTLIQENITTEADEHLIRILLEKLFENAFKFSQPKANPMIEFGEAIDDGQHIYFVKDNGVGFDMSFVDRLFTPFKRLHSQADYAGNGIGLAIVARISHRHGGDVWAEAEIDKGSTFYFRLN